MLKHYKGMFDICTIYVKITSQNIHKKTSCQSPWVGFEKLVRIPWVAPGAGVGGGSVKSY